MDRNHVVLVVPGGCWVALRKESVDRNDNGNAVAVSDLESLSARRAWIEISYRAYYISKQAGRSPQGERG